MLNVKNTSLFLLLSLLIACGDKGGKAGEDLASLKKQQKELQDKISKLEANGKGKDSLHKVPVIVTSMTPSTFNNYIDIQGKVELDEIANAISEAPGIISAIYAKPGQVVKKGQVLATLRAETADKGLAEIEQQISLTKTLYEKQQRLWAQEIGTEIQLLMAKNNYEAAVKRKETVLSQKNSYNVYSPINGIVDAVDAKVGDAFAPPMSVPVIRIINPYKLKVKADVPENYSSIVHGNNTCLLVFPDLQDSIGSHLNYVEKTINPVSRTYAAYIPVPSNPHIQPNMTAKVKIVTYANNRAFVLPAAVLQKTDKGHFVYVADASNKAKLIPVQVGNSYQSKVEIVSGLTLGDKVITTGYEELNEGDVLEIQ